MSSDPYRLPPARFPYGAPMGRSTKLPSVLTSRVRLIRVRLNSGGYDRNGHYFGYGGAPLYFAYAEGTGTHDCEPFQQAAEGEENLLDWTFRASDRDDAKSIVREKYPDAQFYR